MFNNADFKVAKRRHCLLNNRKLKLTSNSNSLLLSNKRVVFYKTALQCRNDRFLIHGNRNVCSITGNYRAVFNSLKISRHVYRLFGDTSSLPNFSKVSW